MKKIMMFFRDGKFEEILGCLAITTVIVPVILNIINRSLLGSYSTSLEVIALLAYVWIGYGFFGLMYKRDSHVDVAFVVNKMPPRVQIFLGFLRDVLIFFFSVYMVYWGLKLSYTNLARYASGTKIPLTFGYAGIAFGFFSGAVRSFWAIITRFLRKKEEVTKHE